MIQLPDGRFRGFIAGGRTYAIDGKNLWDMGGPRRLVFDIGAPSTYDSCGQWIHHVEQSGSKIIAWVHNETECHYAGHVQSHMSTSLAISNDYGLTWKDYGLILTGTDRPRPTRSLGKTASLSSCGMATTMLTSGAIGMAEQSWPARLFPTPVPASG